MTDDRPSASQDGGPSGSYKVPLQYPAPPGARRPRAWGPGSEGTTGHAAWGGQGPPVVPPDEPGPLPWAPASVSGVEADRWAPAPAARAGGTALLDRPTVARRPVVAPPVVPPPGSGLEPAWDWDDRHRLRNALMVAAAILLVGSIVAAVVIFRNRHDGETSRSQTPVAQTSTSAVVQPVVPPSDPGSTVPAVPPPAPVTPAPVTTAAPAQPPAVPPTTPPTTQAPTPTTQAVVPPIKVTPVPGPTPTTRTTTTTRSNTD